jgi:ketosteroid isomerase-like protein
VNTVVVSQTKVEAVRTAYNALNEGDMGPYLALFDEEGEFREPPSLPYGGSHHGHDGLLRLVGALDELWEGTTYQVDTLVAEDDYVIVLGRVRSRSRRTGDEIDEPMIEVLRFRNGKIVSAHAHADTARFLQALGLTSAAAA